MLIVAKGQVECLQYILVINIICIKSREPKHLLHNHLFISINKKVWKQVVTIQSPVFVANHQMSLHVHRCVSTICPFCLKLFSSNSAGFVAGGHEAWKEQSAHSCQISLETLRNLVLESEMWSRGMYSACKEAGQNKVASGRVHIFLPHRDQVLQIHQLFLSDQIVHHPIIKLFATKS